MWPEDAITSRNSLTYKDAGVDIDAKTVAMRAVAGLARQTHGPSVLTGIGSFGALFRPDFSGLKDPVLVSSTDGVGTKMKIAAQLGHFESVGQDLVTLNVNDIITRGAKPLFFLDYVAFSKLDIQRLDTLMRGIAWGCREVGCALISGETAQMPQVYSGDEMDLAGFVVGAVERDQLLESKNIKAGDVLVGVPSSGLHTNGFSLVRHVFNSDNEPNVLYRHFDELNHQLGQELLVPHRSYYPLMEPVFGLVNGLAHITGGGISENLPRVLPDGLGARIDLSAWQLPPVFDWLWKSGGLDTHEILKTFNVGIGLIVVARAVAAGHLADLLTGEGERVMRIGDVTDTPGIEYIGHLA